MALDYELEDQLALRKLKEAAALRQADINPQGTFRGRMYIPDYAPMANGVLDRLSGNKMEDQSEARLRDLAQQQQGEVDTYNKAVSTPGSKRVLERTLSDVGPAEPTMQDIPLSPEEENQRQMALSLDASRLPNARKIAAQFIQSGVGFPEKQAQLKAQQDLMREQQAARLAAQAEQQAARLEAQKERDANNNALKMTLAQMAAASRATGSSNADLQRELIQARIDKLREDPKPTAAEAKEAGALKKAGEGATRIEGLIKEADTNQGAFGVVPAVASMLPNVIGSRVTSRTLTEPQQVTRAKVMTEGAKAIHDIYGAALSRGEAARADSWAPNPNDDYPTIRRKMKAAQEYARSIAGQPAPAGAAPAAGGIKILSVE